MKRKRTNEVIVDWNQVKLEITTLDRHSLFMNNHQLGGISIFSSRLFCECYFYAIANPLLYKRSWQKGIINLVLQTAPSKRQ